jgi:ureidoacrylate peracid hydrolase
MCVESTARDAAQRDYRTFVVKDATADIETIRYEQALINLEFGFARLISVSDAKDKWSG